MATTFITEGITIPAEPEAILAVIGDPMQLPRWASGFAPGVHAEGDEWVIEGPRGLRVRMRTAPELGIVDLIIAGPDGQYRPRALFRVIPGDEGRTELAFTLALPGDLSADDEREQRAIVRMELRTLRGLVSS